MSGVACLAFRAASVLRAKAESCGEWVSEVVYRMMQRRRVRASAVTFMRRVEGIMEDMGRDVSVRGEVR